MDPQYLNDYELKQVVFDKDIKWIENNVVKILEVDLGIGAHCQREYPLEITMLGVCRQLHKNNKKKDLDHPLLFALALSIDKLRDRPLLKPILDEMDTILVSTLISRAYARHSVKPQEKPVTAVMHELIKCGCELIDCDLMYAKDNNIDNIVKRNGNLGEGLNDKVPRISDEWQADSRVLQQASLSENLNLSQYSSTMKVIEKQENRLNNTNWYDNIGKIHQQIIENEVCFPQSNKYIFV